MHDMLVWCCPGTDKHARQARPDVASRQSNASQQAASVPDQRTVSQDANSIAQNPSSRAPGKVGSWHTERPSCRGSICVEIPLTYQK